MIVTVTPNPALDLTYHVPDLEIGESQRVEVAVVRAGGKGLNVARVLHQLGIGVTAIAAIGDRTGGQFEAELTSSGVPHRLLHTATGQTRRSITIVDDRRNETTVLNESGPRYDEADWSRVTAALDALLVSATCVTGSGSLPAETPDSLYADIAARAKAHGLPSVIDATGSALLQAAEAGATALKPNRRELAESTGINDPVVGARRLLDLGASLVVVSLGEEGMLAISASDASEVWRARPARALHGNPTGAGDAAVAAIASILANGIDDPEVILRRATAWSAAAVLMPQAGEIHPRYAEFEARLTITKD